MNTLELKTRKVASIDYFRPCIQSSYKEEVNLYPGQGDIAQMVERSLSMREVWGSIPHISIPIFCLQNRNQWRSNPKRLVGIFLLYQLKNVGVNFFRASNKNKKYFFSDKQLRTV